MNKIRILILDDEKRIRDELREFLQEGHFSVCEAGTPSKAFRLLAEAPVDIAIVDVMLPEMSGLEVLERIKREYPQVEVLMITGHGDMDTVIRAMRLGASDFFPKPFRLPDVLRAIKRTTRFLEMQNELQETSYRYHLVSKELQEKIGSQIVGQEASMQQVVEQMKRVAATPDTSVLITGESGTGKELIARGIHYSSDRRESYFHAVNCSAIPESLFESEFFGHTKGAFTGAESDKPGWFEIADRGTLFLDEIGDMHPSMQVKFLRVLEDRMVRRVGSIRDISFDVRIVAATNHDIAELIAQGKFRNDLLHRLSSFTIDVPPLRERKDDIPMLLSHFIDHFSKKLGRKINSVEPRLIDDLQAYFFPGNIRELRNMVERAMILCDTDRLCRSHFAGLNPDHPKSSENTFETTEDLDLERLEKNTIQRALIRTGNNKSKAADLLNISWQSLDRRLKKYRMDF